jgi:hypothetical protein
MEQIIVKSRDPLKNVMVKYLDLDSLKNLSLTNHFFREISKEQKEVVWNERKLLNQYKKPLREFLKNFESDFYPSPFVQSDSRLFDCAEGFNFSKYNYDDMFSIHLDKKLLDQLFLKIQPNELELVLEFYNETSYSSLSIEDFVNSELPLRIRKLATPFVNIFYKEVPIYYKNAEEFVMENITYPDILMLIEKIKENLKQTSYEYLFHHYFIK